MKLFAPKDNLERETDFTHGITMAHILSQLETRGIKVERKRIYDDIRAFQDYGIEATQPQGKERTNV
jgi:hypothetical protein